MGCLKGRFLSIPWKGMSLRANAFMKDSILIFHGYLLRGTGSNVYNANLARALVKLGYEVHLLCQEQYPQDFDFVDTVADCDGETIHVRMQRTPRFNGRCTVYRPNIAGLLPVYVFDRYEGFEVRTFPELTDEELERYISANVAAVRGVALAYKPEFALANHEIMGPFILCQALADIIPYAMKVHGSALEYTIKPYPRFLPYAREGILGARTVLVGSRHMAVRVLATIDAPELASRIRLGPPGVNVEAFTPRDQQAKINGLRQVTEHLSDMPRTGFNRAAAKQLDRLSGQGIPAWPELLAVRESYDPDGIDEDAPTDVATLDPTTHRIIAYVGKLIVSKGVDLLLCAWPLVLAREPQAKLLVVGFGTYREGLELLLRAIESGHLAAIHQVIQQGRALEGEPPDRLSYLEAFFNKLSDEQRAAYFHAAQGIRCSLIFTGKLGHEILVDLLPAAEALVVPSTFPEAFGMVAAEAAASGVWPIVANHSGLAEVAEVLAKVVPPEHKDLLTFEVGPNAVQEIADRLNTWLALPSEERTHLTKAIREVTVKLWSWEGVAHTVLAACAGRLDELPAPVLPSHPY